MKAPFPYFGGKLKISHEVWAAIGEVRNYVEPFAGSLAVLLNRPAPFDGIETINDMNCFVVNTWRAIAGNPEQLASLLVSPVSEVNTEAQHNALVSSELSLRDQLGDPNWFDLEKAAWWIKGANEWIGSGWCAKEGPWNWTPDKGWCNAGTGINRQLPHLGNAGKGINRQLPHLGNAGKGQYEQRVEAVYGWLCALRDRLCSVRMACGGWERVTGESVTVKHGVTGVFLDPPYDSTEYVYGDEKPVSAEVNKWCAENGGNRLLRIVLAGRDDEHDSLIPLGWRKQIWSGMKGYSKTDDRHAEALWISPHCEQSSQMKQATFI